MKKTFAWLFILAMGCQPPEQSLVEPVLLFQTWHKTTGSTNGQPTTYRLVVEFSRDGELLYGTGKTKTGGSCCSPSSFRSDAEQIEFFFATPDPPYCIRVDCALSDLTVGVVWRIKKLTASELIITADNQTITFEVAP